MTHNPNDRNKQIEALKHPAKKTRLVAGMDDKLARVLNSQRPKIKLPALLCQ